jgi:hypothetical protein
VGWQSCAAAACSAEICDRRVIELLGQALGQTPATATTPASACRHLVRGNTGTIRASQMAGRTAAVMVVPYWMVPAPSPPASAGVPSRQAPVRAGGMFKT